MCFKFVSELTDELASKEKDLEKYVNELKEKNQTDAELSK